MNERGLSIDSEKDLRMYYPDFVFNGRDGSKRKRSHYLLLSLLL